MAHHFVTVDRETPFLLPPSVQEWLPERHLARFVAEIVEQLDLSALEGSYAGRGSKAYHPAMLVALLFYGYATGIFSSRKLEQATYDSLAFRYLCANTHPDHDTIASFRRRFLPELEHVFAQILVLAHEAGLLRLGALSIDGSKVKANASKHKALSYGRACQLEEQIEAEVGALLAQAEATDSLADEADQGLDLPAELERRELRRARIREAKARIEARAAERHRQAQAEYVEKLAQRQEREQASGRKLPSRPPEPPSAQIPDKAQVNLTDPDSRIMLSRGGFEQAYNAQLAVDTETLLILMGRLTQATTDRQEVAPALERLAQLPEPLGQPTHLLGDNGFYSKGNVAEIEAAGLEPLLGLGREGHRDFLKQRQDALAADASGPPPEATAVERMAHRLKTSAGRSLYSKRKATVEPVFGQIKHVMGFRQFQLRGLEKAAGEWCLVSIAWNLKRLFKLHQNASGGPLHPVAAC